MSQIIVPLPWLMQAPRLFAGEIKLGDVTQTASAFGSIQDGLSFFRNAYDTFAGYRAVDHPSARPGDRQRAGPRAADADRRRPARTAWSNSTTSRCVPRTASS